jgi:hypothetical protein
MLPMDEPANTSPTPEPIPPRFYWLKRLTLLAIVSAALLVGLRYLALTLTQRRLTAEVKAIQARGEPLFPADFLDRPAALKDDAGPDLLAACDLFEVPTPHQPAWDNLPRGAYRPQDVPTIDAVLAANQKPLAKLRSARGKRVVNWGLPLKTPVVSVVLPMVNSMRDLSDSLDFAARRAHADGRDSEAVEYLRDWIALSRALKTQPVLVSHLVATAMQDRTSRTIIELAPNIKIGEPNGASEAQLKTAITELLADRQTLRSGRRWCYQGERMLQLDFIFSLMGEDREAIGKAVRVQLYDRWAAWWIRPIMTDNARDLLLALGAEADAAGAPDLPSATTALSKPAARSSPPRGQWDLRSLRSPMFQRSLTPHYNAGLMRRKAAIALAERLYELKYGKQPRKIEDLVPEFLPALPIDPVNAKPMQFGPHR